MEQLDFEWDDEKAASNLAKHGVPFDEALPAFLDVSRLERHDGREDYGEDRFLTIGLADGFVLTITYTLRDDIIRIISARKATLHEQRDYWKNGQVHSRSGQPAQDERGNQGQADGHEG